MPSRIDHERDGVRAFAATRGRGHHSDSTGDKRGAAFRGIEHKDQHCSGLCDVRSRDDCDQLLATDEGRYSKRTIPAHCGVMAEFIAVNSQKEPAASSGCATRRYRGNERRRRTGSAGHGHSQQDREHGYRLAPPAVWLTALRGTAAKAGGRVWIGGSIGSSQLVRQIGTLYARPGKHAALETRNQG